jgi:teichuronic acid biosynthesis glycosyltransferase TuaH
LTAIHPWWTIAAVTAEHFGAKGPGTDRSARSAALPGDWRGLVVFFAGTAWAGNRFPDQHIAERLTAWAPVLYVDPPVSMISRTEKLNAVSPIGKGRLQLIGERLARFTPVVIPPKGRGPMKRVTETLVRRSTARVVRRLTDDVAVTVAATLLPVFGLCGERRSVLYATDDFRAGAELMGISQQWVTQRESAALNTADVVIVVSHYLADSIAHRSDITPIVVENGVDDALFAGVDDAPWPDDVTLARPIAGFVGHLSDRIDLPMLEATAASGCSVLLVGPRQGTFEMSRMDRLLALPNVQWVGAKPFESLPSYVRTMDVGLLPYADTEFNRASFPLKVLEYLAAGRPAVATDLPAIRELGEVVRIESTPAAFAAAVGEVLADQAAGGIDDDMVERRRAIARARSWDTAARRFAEAIGIRPVETGRVTD